MATQDTVTQLVSMIRRVRRAIPAAAAVTVAATTTTTPGKPACAWDDPTARDELVTGLVNDARAILDALDGVALDDEQQQLVGLLALVAGQDVEEGDQPGSWRIARKVAKERVISTVDPETRHMHKSRSNYRDGYKAHLAVEPETGIITDVELTPANTGDGPVGVALLDDETDAVEVFADSAYGSGPVRADLAERGHTAVIKPWPTARNPYLDDDQFRRDDFRIDYTARTVTCPNGITVTISTGGTATFGARCARLPAAVSLHRQRHRQDVHRHRTRPAARRRPRRLASRHRCRRLPAMAATRRTFHRLARRRRTPPRPLPRRRTQPARPQRPRRRHQPAPTPQPRPHPHRQRLDARHLTSGSGADKEGTTPSAISHPARPTLTLNIDSSVGHVPGPTTNATTT